MSIDAAFTRFPSLSTNRLCLRKIRSTDADDLFVTFSDEVAMQFYGHEPHRTVENTHALIEQFQARYIRREAIRWGITFKGEDRVLGTCGFHNFDAGFHRTETGYELHRAYWGQGLMTEAVAAILSYGFDLMGLHRVEAIIDLANERSKGLLLKLGFTYEGNLRQRYSFGDQFEDEHFFGLIRDEWHGLV